MSDDINKIAKGLTPRYPRPVAPDPVAEAQRAIEHAVHAREVRDLIMKFQAWAMTNHIPTNWRSGTTRGWIIYYIDPGKDAQPWVTSTAVVVTIFGGIVTSHGDRMIARKLLGSPSGPPPDLGSLKMYDLKERIAQYVADSGVPW